MKTSDIEKLIYPVGFYKTKSKLLIMELVVKNATYKGLTVKDTLPETVPLDK